MSAHALLAPSSAARWVACAGSVMLAALYPETEEKPDAVEGTAAHWAASEILYGCPVDPGLVAPNGITLTLEMCEAADLYVETIDAALNKYALTREALHVEERVDIPGVHEQNWGTPDCWFYVPGENVLCVFDFKYGHGYVEVFENWQLIDYASGIYTKLDAAFRKNNFVFPYPTCKVEFCIVQPRNYDRAGPVRKWETKLQDLAPMFDRLRQAANAALSSDVTCAPNPECVHCPGRHACQALQRDAYRSAQISTDSLPLQLSPAALGVELAFLKRAANLLESRISGLEETATAMLRRGDSVPHFRLAETRGGREKWIKSDNEISTLGVLYNVTLTKPAFVTPEQARKAGIPADVVAKYAARPPSTLKLESFDDSQARKVFGS